MVIFLARNRVESPGKTVKNGITGFKDIKGAELQ